MIVRRKGEIICKVRSQRRDGRSTNGNFAKGKTRATRVFCAIQLADTAGCIGKTIAANLRRAGFAFVLLDDVVIQALIVPYIAALHPEDHVFGNIGCMIRHTLQRA
jgi:hypothetical protein